MSFPNITYTLLNGSIIDETQINQNFTDIINGLSDGTKDLNVNDAIITGTCICDSLYLTGAATFSSTLAVTGTSTYNDATIASNDTITKRLGLTSKTTYTIDTSAAIEPDRSYIELNSEIYQTTDFSSIEITLNVNDKIDIDEGTGEITATISSGTYIPSALATEIETQLNAIGTNLYIVTYSSVNERFTITSDDSMTMLWATGSNHDTTCGKSIGVDIMVNESDTVFISDYQFQIDYTDTLETITPTNFSAGDIVILSMTSNATSLSFTIADGTGNINCGSDQTLDSITDKISLLYDGTNFNMLSFSSN